MQAPSKDQLRTDLNSFVKDELLPQLSWWKKAIVGQLLGGIPDALIHQTAQLITAKFPSTGIDQVCQGIFGPETCALKPTPLQPYKIIYVFCNPARLCTFCVLFATSS